MSNKQELLARIAAIVSALDETNGSPESTLYIFCDMDMRAYEVVRNILLQAKLVSIKGHFVTLTEQGRETAHKLNAAINKVN